jgi:hypothetical protein
MKIFSAITSSITSLIPGLHVAGTSITDVFAKEMANEFFNVVSGLVEGAVRSFVNEVLDSAVTQTSAVSAAEGNHWFAGIAALMLPVVKFVVAPLLMAATLMAVVRLDPRRLARAWAVGLPVCAIGGYAAVQLADVGLWATDGLSKLIVKDVAPGMKTDFVRALSAGLTSGSAGAAGMLLSVVVLAGGLLIWLELSVRAVAVELAVFFMPLALAGVVWPATAHWAKRLAETLGALLLVKPVVVGALCLGTGTLDQKHSGLGSVVSGAAILLLAGFSPLFLLKMVPIVEAGSVAHLHELSRQSVHVVERAAQRAIAFTTGASAPAALAAGGGEDMQLAGVLLTQATNSGADGSGGWGDAPSGAGHPLGPARPPAGSDGPEGGAHLGGSGASGEGGDDG